MVELAAGTRDMRLHHCFRFTVVVWPMLRQQRPPEVEGEGPSVLWFYEESPLRNIIDTVISHVFHMVCFCL